MLSISNMNKAYNKGTSEEARVFEAFSLEVGENESIAVIGPNGCGKSTLFNIISGSVEADGGDIVLNGQDISNMAENERAEYIGKVNQDPFLGVSPNLTVLENMALSLKKGGDFTLKPLLSNTDKDKIIDSLKSLNLGLENKLNTKVKLLSGGQRQSLSLLMATLVRPDLLLLDEHTAALDPKTSYLIMEKTKDLIMKENITTLMITHDLDYAARYSDRIIMLSKGEIAFDCQSDGLDGSDLRNMYAEIVKEEIM